MTQESGGPVTFINVFELDPERADEFITGWKERGEFMRRQPGFRSFRLHRALAPDASYQLVNVAVLREAATRFGAIAHPAVYTTIVQAVAN